MIFLLVLKRNCSLIFLIHEETCSYHLDGLLWFQKVHFIAFESKSTKLVSDMAGVRTCRCLGFLTSCLKRSDIGGGRIEPRTQDVGINALNLQAHSGSWIYPFKSTSNSAHTLNLQSNWCKFKCKFYRATNHLESISHLTSTEEERSGGQNADGDEGLIYTIFTHKRSNRR